MSKKPRKAVDAQRVLEMLKKAFYFQMAQGKFFLKDLQESTGSVTDALSKSCYCVTVAGDSGYQYKGGMPTMADAEIVFEIHKASKNTSNTARIDALEIIVADLQRTVAELESDKNVILSPNLFGEVSS